MNSADEEMLALGDSSMDLRTTAVISSEFKNIKAPKSVDSSAKITLTKYGVNTLQYTSNNKFEGPVVFSEIYYPEGWNCYIDGKLTPNFRANYILRGVKLLKGEHKIVWKFEPSTFFKAKTASMFGSLTLISLCLVVFGLKLRPFLSKSDDSLI